MEMMKLKDTFVKGGVVQRVLMERILNKYKSDKDTLIRLLDVTDVMVPKDGKSYLFPAMLSDPPPAALHLTVKGAKDNFRRSYFLSSALPEGGAGKAIAGVMRWGGVTLQMWRNGCVVTKEDVRICLRCESLTKIHVLVSSSGSDRAAFLHTIAYVQRTIDHLLSVYFSISFTEVVPVDDLCDDWCPLASVRKTISKKKAMIVTAQGKKVRVDILCPDVTTDKMIPSFGRGDIQDLGTFCETPCGTVWKGSLRNEIKSVLIKSFPSAPERSLCDTIDNLTSLAHELYIMNALRHPNIVQLLGLCDGVTPRGFVMESVDGLDLHTALCDPSQLLSHLNAFTSAFDFYKFHPKSSVSMEVVLRNEVSRLRASVQSGGSGKLKKKVERLIQSAGDQWLCSTPQISPKLIRGVSICVCVYVCMCVSVSLIFVDAV